MTKKDFSENNKAKKLRTSDHFRIISKTTHGKHQKRGLESHEFCNIKRVRTLFKFSANLIGISLLKVFSKFPAVNVSTFS